MCQRDKSIHDWVNTGLAGFAFVLALGSFAYSHWRLEATDAFEAEELLNRAWQHIGRSELAQAKELILLADMKEADSPRGFAYRGLIQHLVGDSHSAIPYYEEALRLSPDYVAGRLFITQALLHTGDFEAAERHLERAQRSVEQERFQDVTLLSSIELTRGHVQSRQGRLDEAVDIYRAACEQDPSNTEAQLALADALIARGEHEAGLSLYDQVLLQEPENALHWQSAGLLLYLLEEYRPAEHALRRSLQLDPHLPAHEVLALTLRAQGRDDEADDILALSWRLRTLQELPRRPEEQLPQ